MIGGYIGLDIGGVLGGVKIAPAAPADRMVTVKGGGRAVTVKLEARTVVVKSK